MLGKGDSYKGSAQRNRSADLQVGSRMRKLLRLILGELVEMSENHTGTNAFLSDMQGEMESQGVALERIANALDQIENHLDAIRKVAERNV
jgi:hypothetical protein